TCGRELTEIVKLRELMKEITSLAIEYDYENIDDFTQYIARKIVKMIDYQKANPETSAEVNANAD
ncbi:MAG: hypothetical protein ABW138_09565, partial [Candidatus Thiodiazotropha sp. 4PDIVS1]